jgi:hypothetical protein
MAKVKFRFSIKEIEFEYEGDQETGRAISESMQNTFGSFAQAQNAVIDVTPRELEQQALPAAPVYAASPGRRRHRAKSRTPTNGIAVSSPLAHGDSPVAPDSIVKPSRSRKPRHEGFRAQTYRLLSEGYFANPRTAADIQAEHEKNGFTYDIKNIASELTDFTKKQFLIREKDADGKYAYIKGSNNAFPGGEGGS